MSGGSSKSKAKDLTPPEFAALRGEIAGRLSDAAGGQGPATQAFDPGAGGFAAGPTDQELAQIANIQGIAGNEGTSQTQAFLESRLRGDEFDFTNNPEFNKILDFAGDRFLGAFDQREEANKALFARAGQRIQDSSPFAAAQSRISEAKAQGLSDIGAQIIGQQFGAARERQFEAAGQLSNLETARLERAREALEAAALPRLIADLGLERGREEFARRQDNILKALGLELEAASPTVGVSSSSVQVGIL